MNEQVFVPIKDTLTWITGGMTLEECLYDFLWDTLEGNLGADAADALMDQAIPTVQIDGAYFVVGLKE